MDILNIGQMLYIDPAATSVLLSSITSIIVACGATFIIVWRKLRKKIKKTLHIDDNAGKEVEADLVINEDSSNAEQAGSTAEPNAESEQENKEDSEKEEK